MKNNKQININKIIKKNHFLANFRCWERIDKLSKKAILTTFEKQELLYLNNRITDINWYSDINTRVLFIHLLLKASSTNRTYRNIKLKKGQLITSVKLLSEQTGLTTQKVRTYINRLKSTNEITATTNMQYTVITLKKWADYQGFSANEQQTDNNS